MDKDIRFTEKKIDESWKEQAFREKVTQPKTTPKSAPEPPVDTPKPVKADSAKTSKPFFNFINSLGFQAMIQLGEIPNPETNVKEVNLDACREIIDLLNSLKEKTQGNWGDEEEYFFTRFLPELQLKFASKA